MYTLANIKAGKVPIKFIQIPPVPAARCILLFSSAVGCSDEPAWACVSVQSSIVGVQYVHNTTTWTTKPSTAMFTDG